MPLRRPPAIIWAIADTTAQRGVSALVTLIVARETGPAIVGAVTAVTLILTAYYAGLEYPLRYVGHRATVSARASTAFRRLVSGSASAGVVALILTLGLLLATGFSTPSATLELVPIAVVPLVTASALHRTIRLQQAERWRRVAVIRVVSTTTGLLSCLLAVAVGLPVLAVAVQLLVSEGLFSVLIRRSPAPSPRIDPAPYGLAADFAHTSVSSLLGYLRGQTERLVMVGLGSATILGSYSLAVAVSRTIGEAAMGGGMNLLRARLPALDRVGWRHAITRIAVQFQAALLGIAVLTLAAALLVLAPLLGDKWSASFAVVPLLSASLFATGHAALCGAVLNQAGESKRAYPTQVLEIVLSIGIALLATHVSLVAAGWAYLGREASSAIALTVLARRHMSGASVLAAAVPTALLLAFALLHVD